LSGWGVERLESWQVGSWSPSDRWKVRQRNQGSQSERGARGVRATDPEARDPFTPPARRRLGPTDQAAVKAGRPRGTEQAAHQAAQATGALHHLDRAETPEATGPKTIESPPGRPGSRPLSLRAYSGHPGPECIKGSRARFFLSWVLHESLWRLVLK